MNEKQFQIIWAKKLFDYNNLLTTFGQKIIILNFGELNNNQGPDIINAKIQIDKEIFIGNIELHLNNNNWYSHKHHKDNNYNNVILHVVFKKTLEIYTLNESKNMIPILYLEDKILPNINIEPKNEVICKSFNKNINIEKLSNWKKWLAINRLNRKSIEITESLKENNNDFENTFYQMLLANFGIKINSIFFKSIGKSLDQKILAKNIDNLFILESLLMGQANLLHFNDDYCIDLANEYKYQKNKYNLIPSNEKALFSKLFPSSFPTMRLAQFAAFIHNKSGLYSILTNENNIKKIYNLFEINVSEYWQTHYSFTKTNKKTNNKLSIEFIDKIIINTIIPFKYFLIKIKNNDIGICLEMLESIKSEKNKSLDTIKNSLQVKSKTSLDSQAYIEQFNEYCIKKECSNCFFYNCIGK